MPKTKLGCRPVSPYVRVSETIRNYAARHGMSMPELAGECQPQGISYYTLLRRLKNPQEFTLGEISALAKVLDIPIDELRACIVKA